MKKRKILLHILIACMIITIFAACTKKAEKQENLNTANSGGLIAEEPLNLTIHMHYWDRMVFDDEWPVFKKAGELTNVYLKGVASKTASNSNQVFNIMMASGDLPDIIHLTKDNANKYGQEGALIPLDDLIEKHAPNIKKFFEEHPDYKKHVTAADGNIYALTFMADGEAAVGYFIRKDWLDKLGLEIPKTVDEYYNVLKAFKEKDPNGNSRQDEIPFFSREAAEVIRFTNFYGARTGWYIDENGKVHYGQYDEKYKDAIANVARWYQEGLIDPEIFTRGSKAREELLGNNVGGSTHDWFGSTASYNDLLKEKVPGIEFVPIAPPADINGVQWEERARILLGTNSWGISYTNKYPVETIKYFDFWFSEEGRRLMNFGIEGEHYIMVDGKPQFTDKVFNSGDTVLNTLNKVGAQIEIAFHQDFEYERQWLNPIAVEGVEMYVKGGYIVEQFPSLSFTEQENKVIQEKWPSIRTFIEEKRQEWILGAGSPEQEFNDYIARLKDMGMEEVIAAYQSAYDRYNKQ